MPQPDSRDLNLNHYETVTPIQLALQHHKAGRLQEAEQICRQILSSDPNNAEANYYLGIIAFQFEKNDIVIQYFKKAIQANPNFPVLYNDLGKAYNRLRRFNDAVVSYNKATCLLQAALGRILSLILQNKKESSNSECNPSPSAYI